MPCCAHCSEPILPDENWLEIPTVTQDRAYIAVLHSECFQRRIIGGLNHLQGHCTCCGGIEPPDPPGVSKRTAARLAVNYWANKLVYKCP